MINLTIQYEQGTTVSLSFENAAEARRELINRTRTVSRQGNGARGILLSNKDNRIIGTYSIEEERSLP